MECSSTGDELACLHPTDSAQLRASALTPRRATGWRRHATRMREAAGAASGEGEKAPTRGQNDVAKDTRRGRAMLLRGWHRAGAHSVSSAVPEWTLVGKAGLDERGPRQVPGCSDEARTCREGGPWEGHVPTAVSYFLTPCLLTGLRPCSLWRWIASSRMETGCTCPSSDAGRCWMDALELSLRCSSLLRRTMGRETPSGQVSRSLDPEKPLADEEEQEDESNLFEDEAPEDDAAETPYQPEVAEIFGELGDQGQTEEVADENKSIIWALVKQVRPGMDLSKVVLPTFILEPRSFLEKLADYYYHADLIQQAVQADDPFTRMVSVVRFYLSGFYKKPKGLKKPYNPILGEVFRCAWKHDSSESRTFYIAEQVSHHPPITALFVSNRKEGFAIQGSILAKSKFYGNSLSAILDGNLELTLLSRGETYLITLPYAHCKGILLGTLTMELGGKVLLVCEKTAYSAEIEFRLKPLLGGSDQVNTISGKVKLGPETLATFDGHWDGKIDLHDRRSGRSEVLWEATAETIKRRLAKFAVPMEYQNHFESTKLWHAVTVALCSGDQKAATAEKFRLEDGQRADARRRKERGEVYQPRLFAFNPATQNWCYKYGDLRPWDPSNDILQLERDCVIRTHTHHSASVPRPNTLGQPQVDSETSSDESSESVPHDPEIERNRSHSLLTNLIQSQAQLQASVNALHQEVRHLRTPAMSWSKQAMLVLVVAVVLQWLHSWMLR